MLTVVLLIVVAAIAVAVLPALGVPVARRFVAIAGFALIYIPVLVAWWWLLYFQLVPLDAMLAAKHIYRLEPFWARLILLGPPSLPAVVFVVYFLSRRGPCKEFKSPRIR